jgi:uncharacterized membrane protein YdjX (TVP38/TMEM64 family)
MPTMFRFRKAVRTSLVAVAQTFVLSLLIFGIGLTASNPALAQSDSSLSFHPQVFLQQALDWVKSLGPLSAVAFIGLYILAAVAFFPGAILTLGAGAVFGLIGGSVYVFIGATLGAAAAFLIGRYLARGWIAQKIAGNDRFQAIDEAVGREGFKIVLLTRLSPVFPFSFLNYAYGLTKVSFKDYLLGSVGMIPGTILYVYIGTLAGSLSSIGSKTQPEMRVQWAIRILGFLATVAVSIYVTRIARKALETQISSKEAS